MMGRHLLLLALPVLLVTTACVVPRPIRPSALPRPAGPFPDVTRPAEVQPAASPLGGALDLEALQVAARQRNPSVEEWAARVAAFEARAAQIRSGYFPDLRSQGQYLHLDEEVGFSDPLGNRFVVQDQDTYTQVTTLGYRLIDWGQTHFAHQAGQLEVASEEATRRRRLQALDWHVAAAFFAVLETRKEIDTLSASVDTLEGALKLARDLKEVGGATQADVLVVEANLERRGFQERSLTDLLRHQEEELARLLDVPPETRLELEEPSTLPEENAQANYWQGLAFQHREELRALEAAHDAVLEARKSERAGFLPEIGFFLQHEYSTTDSALRDDQFFSGGFTASWELFDGGRRWFRLRELQEEMRQIKARHRSMTREIQVEVRRAARATLRARDGLRVAQKVVRQVEENLRRVTNLFREGRATGQEVLEAERLQTAERAREVKARFGILRSLAELRFVCGVDDSKLLDESDVNSLTDGTTSRSDGAQQ